MSPSENFQLQEVPHEVLPEVLPEAPPVVLLDVHLEVLRSFDHTGVIPILGPFDLSRSLKSRDNNLWWWVGGKPNVGSGL